MLKKADHSGWIHVNAVMTKFKTERQRYRRVALFLSLKSSTELLPMMFAHLWQPPVVFVLTNFPVSWCSLLLVALHKSNSSVRYIPKFIDLR